MRPDANDAKSTRRRRHRSRRWRAHVRRTVPMLSAALLTGLLLAPNALAGFFTPESGGSPNANEIDSLYKIVLYIAAFVFILVEGALVYSLYKFRAKKNPVAAQIHGNTRLEIGWTVGAALILVVLTVVTFVKLPGIINPPNSNADGMVLSASLTQPSPPNGKKLDICVQGRQFIWRYYYSSSSQSCQKDSFKLPYSYEKLVVPVDTTVVLSITATDVIHSWWVPAMGGKVDAVPGYTTYTWFKALHTGTYRGQCAQLCGIGHASMIAQIEVVTPAVYQQWLAQQQASINSANNQVQQLRTILTQQGDLGN